MTTPTEQPDRTVADILSDPMWTTPELATAINAILAALDTPPAAKAIPVILPVLYAAGGDSTDRELFFELGAERFGWECDDIRAAWLHPERVNA